MAKKSTKESKSARTTIADPAGDHLTRIEDKVRALPENQGLNETEMWQKIDAEVEAAKADGSFLDIESSIDKHGN